MKLNELAGMTERQIDAAVAEKVMGWRWVNGTSIPYSVFMSPEDQAKSGGRVVDEPTDSAGIGLEHVLYYSTNISRAFEVEAEIERRGRTVMLDYCDALMHQCGVGSFSLGENLFKLIHASPLARCRAALAAVKGEGDGK